MTIWQQLKAQRENHRWQVWSDVLVPWAFSRSLLIFVGWFSYYFGANQNYGDPGALTRGWQFSPIKLLDMWGRWDASWYLDIALHGYSLRGPLATTQSNVAFFPLYPFSIRAVLLLLPEGWRTPETALLIGVILSNIAFLAALLLLYRLTRLLIDDRAVAQRTQWYTVLFPAALFFSCVYTEALFFLLSIAAFYAALRHTWWAAGILGALATLTRPTGILLVIPLAWIYGEAIKWKLREMRWNIMWLAGLPLAYLGFTFSLYPITGDWLAPLHVQAAWFARFTAPWVTFFSSEGGAGPYITRVDQLAVLGAFALAVIALIKLPSKALGFYILLAIAGTFAKGLMHSASRFVSVAFPIYITLAILGKNQTFDRLVLIGFAATQALLMAVWTRFYWVG